MITMYKLMNGLIRIDRMDLFTPPNTLQTRGHLQRVYKEPATEGKEKFFLATCCGRLEQPPGRCY